MPQKTWVVGEEVLAPDFNNFVQTQVIPRFASVAARDSGWPAATALPGAFCVTTDTNTLWQVIGAAWALPKNWATAWGELGYGEGTAAGGAFGPAITDVPGCSVTWSALPGRRYELIGQVKVTVTAADTITLTLATAANAVVQTAKQIATPAGAYINLVLLRTLSGLSGPVTYKLRLNGIASSMTLEQGATIPSVLRVHDIGPVAGAQPT